jgi:hypothetical protein
MRTSGEDDEATRPGLRPLAEREPTSYLAARPGLRVLTTAGRHGIRLDDAVHALAHSVRTFDVGEGMTMVIGPSTTGAFLEVGVVEWHGDLAVVHAMPARRRFLR